jgi:hypothetical protein
MRFWLVALLLALLPGVANAKTLLVGPGRDYDKPSLAARAAEPGDTISIAPGEYFDCAIWGADNLTIVGEEGGDTVLTDVACGGKGAFVIAGNGVVVRHIAFTRIRVPDDNGAGIRSNGRDLTVQDSRFVNTQMGILSDSPGGGFLRVESCVFTEIGSTLNGRVNYAVRAANFDLVRVAHSDFSKARAGADMSILAARTELVGNHLADEGGHMTGPMVLVQGGALLLEGNNIDLAAGAAERQGVVLATGTATAIAVRGNTLRDAGTAATPLLRNWTDRDATVGPGNIVPAGTDIVTDAGIVWHHIRATAADMRDTAHELYRVARHLAATVVHMVR